MTGGAYRHIAAAVAGVVAGATLMLAASGFSREQQDPAPGTPPPPAPGSLRAADAYVVWSPAGLPRRTPKALRRIAGVQRATLVRAGVDWIAGVRTPEGTRLRVRPPGYHIPWEVAAVRPGGYAHFVPPAERDALLALRRGEVLLSETSARLRGEVSDIRLLDRTVRVGGVVSDAAANGYEAIMRGPTPSAWHGIDEFVLVAGDGIGRSRLRRRLDSLLPPATSFVVRARGENPFLRYGDAVLPQSLIKDVFGEFAARPRADGYLDLDSGWRKANIRTVRVPVLGTVTCHRTLIPQLRAALRALVAEGLGQLLDSGDYGGCFSPRFINARPDGRLSHHAWGIAFDVNVSENAFGTEADLDPRAVEVLESWGFTWGGRWLIPDGMHFEWRAFP